MGPEFWIMAIFPFYVSWVWASKQFIPSYDWLVSNPITPLNFFSTLGRYIVRSGDFILGAIILGPLLGGGTLLLDDYHDRHLDTNNPRKVKLPLFTWSFKPGLLLFSSLFLFLLSIMLAFLLSRAFLGIVLLLVVLSILYSTPPVKLKARGGLDLLANILGFSVLCSIAGWVLVSPVSEYPWLWIPPMAAGTGALYIPTALADMDSDRGMGIGTIAVRLGRTNSVHLATGLLILANVLILMLGSMEYLYGPKVPVRAWPIAVVEVLLFSYFLKGQDLGGILKALFSTTLLMGAGTMLLILNYVGIWVLH